MTTHNLTERTTVSNPAHVAEPERIIWRRNLRRRLGVCGETMRVWMRDGKLPPPDIAATPKSTGWKISTLQAAGFNL